MLLKDYKKYHDTHGLNQPKYTTILGIWNSKLNILGLHFLYIRQKKVYTTESTTYHG